MRKKLVWNFAHCFKILWNLRQKNKSFNRKISFRVVTNAIRASTGKFCRTSFLLPEKICFLFETWICSNFFVPWQKSYLGEPKQQCTCLQETFVGTLLWKTVFFSIVRTLSREIWTFYGKRMARLSKLQRKWPSEKNSGKCFRIADLSSILNVDQEEFGIYRKKLGWDFKTNFYVSRGTLTEQRFWQKVFKVSGFSAE